MTEACRRGCRASFEADHRRSGGEGTWATTTPSHRQAHGSTAARPPLQRGDGTAVRRHRDGRVGATALLLLAGLLTVGPAGAETGAIPDPWQTWRAAGLGPVAGLLRHPGEVLAQWRAAAVDGEETGPEAVDYGLQSCRLEQVDLPRPVVIGPDLKTDRAWRFHLRCEKPPIGAAPLVLWLGQRPIGRLVADPQDPQGLVTLLFAAEAPAVDDAIGLGPAPGPARAWLPAVPDAEADVD